jgi:hypothetical protein
MTARKVHAITAQTQSGVFSGVTKMEMNNPIHIPTFTAAYFFQAFIDCVGAPPPSRQAELCKLESMVNAEIVHVKLPITRRGLIGS